MQVVPPLDDLASPVMLRQVERGVGIVTDTVSNRQVKLHRHFHGVGSPGGGPPGIFLYQRVVTIDYGRRNQIGPKIFRKIY